MDFLFIVKIILEGLAVAMAAFFIPKKEMNFESIIAIALSASAIFLLLDQFSPEIGASVRQGAGIGIGLNQVGWGANEHFEDCKLLCKKNSSKCNKGPCQDGGNHFTNNEISQYEIHNPPPQWSQTNVMGRRMNFDESGCPVNKNTNEYKLVPGQYSKYTLQSGYNENVVGYNDDELKNINCLTNNPLDLNQIHSVSDNVGKMAHY